MQVKHDIDIEDVTSKYELSKLVLSEHATEFNDISSKGVIVVRALIDVI